jgi:hypothetical protein
MLDEERWEAYGQIRREADDKSYSSKKNSGQIRNETVDKSHVRTNMARIIDKSYRK